LTSLWIFLVSLFLLFGVPLPFNSSFLSLLFTFFLSSPTSSF
jgi:hypothetical protein